MNKNRIRLTESQLHRVIKESVKKVLNEISLDTLNNATSQAYKDATDIQIAQGMDSLFGSHSVSDDDLRRLARRERQAPLFKKEFERRKAIEGKRTYYILPLMHGQPTGEVKEVYLTPQEAQEYNGYIFDDYLDACRYMQN